MENERENSVVVPSHWVKEDDNILYWPPKGVSDAFAIKSWLIPSNNWRVYPLVKVKMSGETKSLCDSYVDFESTAVDSDGSDGNSKINTSYLISFQILFHFISLYIFFSCFLTYCNYIYQQLTLSFFPF